MFSLCRDSVRLAPPFRLHVDSRRGFAEVVRRFLKIQNAAIPSLDKARGIPKGLKRRIEKQEKECSLRFGHTLKWTSVITDRAHTSVLANYASDLRAHSSFKDLIVGYTQWPALYPEICFQNLSQIVCDKQALSRLPDTHYWSLKHSLKAELCLNLQSPVDFMRQSAAFAEDNSDKAKKRKSKKKKKGKCEKSPEIASDSLSVLPQSEGSLVAFEATDGTLVDERSEFERRVQSKVKQTHWRIATDPNAVYDLFGANVVKSYFKDSFSVKRKDASSVEQLMADGLGFHCPVLSRNEDVAVVFRENCNDVCAFGRLKRLLCAVEFDCVLLSDLSAMDVGRDYYSHVYREVAQQSAAAGNSVNASPFNHTSGTRDHKTGLYFLRRYCILPLFRLLHSWPFACTARVLKCQLKYGYYLKRAFSHRLLLGRHFSSLFGFSQASQPSFHSFATDKLLRYLRRAKRTELAVVPCAVPSLVYGNLCESYAALFDSQQLAACLHHSSGTLIPFVLGSVATAQRALAHLKNTSLRFEHRLMAVLSPTLLPHTALCGQFNNDLLLQSLRHLLNPKSDKTPKRILIVCNNLRCFDLLAKLKGLLSTRDVINEQAFDPQKSHIRINQGPFQRPNFAHCLADPSPENWKTIQSFYGSKFAKHLMDSFQRDKARFSHQKRTQAIKSKLLSN